MEAVITPLSRRELRRLINHYAQELGGTRDEVAARLQADGIQGIPRNTGECALARLFKAVVAADVSVEHLSVTRSFVKVCQPGRTWPLLVLLPHACSRFIAAFDQGLFPELDERLPRATAETAGPSRDPLSDLSPVSASAEG